MRSGQLDGAKFRRQEPILGFTVAFVCHEHRLIVELDGGQHNDLIETDARRTKLLNQAGFRVLRFWNNDVIDNPAGVGDRIRAALARESAALAETLSPRGEDGEAPIDEALP